MKTQKLLKLLLVAFLISLLVLAACEGGYKDVVPISDITRHNDYGGKESIVCWQGHKYWLRYNGRRVATMTPINGADGLPEECNSTSTP